MGMAAILINGLLPFSNLLFPWPKDKQNDPFPVTNWVKQGCVLASTLFSMMFSAMLTDAFQDGDNGIPIRYHFHGKLFNLRRLQAKSKVQAEVLHEFLFADDMEKGAPTEEKMQKVWIKYLIHVTAMISQSASKRLRWYISQHLEILTWSLPPQWKVSDYKW